jgi:hypothetical protein
MQRLDNIIHIISRTLNAILLLTQVWTQVTQQLSDILLHQQENWNTRSDAVQCHLHVDGTSENLASILYKRAQEDADPV